MTNLFSIRHCCSSPLSQRESEILKLVAEGKSNKTIAHFCNVSEPTVKVHLKSILRKTNTQNRTQAAIWAIEHGFRKLSLEGRAPVLADAPTLLPLATPQVVHYDSAADTASGDEGLSPKAPSPGHIRSDPPRGR
jgi:DNA-binding CsgD family transcriptional regulator